MGGEQAERTLGLVGEITVVKDTRQLWQHSKEYNKYLN